MKEGQVFPGSKNSKDYEAVPDDDSDEGSSVDPDPAHSTRSFASLSSFFGSEIDCHRASLPGSEADLHSHSLPTSGFDESYDESNRIPALSSSFDICTSQIRTAHQEKILETSDTTDSTSSVHFLPIVSDNTAVVNETVLSEIINTKEICVSSFNDTKRNDTLSGEESNYEDVLFQELNTKEKLKPEQLESTGWKRTESKDLEENNSRLSRDDESSKLVIKESNLLDRNDNLGISCGATLDLVDQEKVNTLSDRLTEWATQELRNTETDKCFRQYSKPLIKEGNRGINIDFVRKSDVMNYELDSPLLQMRRASGMDEELTEDQMDSSLTTDQSHLDTFQSKKISSTDNESWKFIGKHRPVVTDAEDINGNSVKRGRKDERLNIMATRENEDIRNSDEEERREDIEKESDASREENFKETYSAELILAQGENFSLNISDFEDTLKREVHQKRIEVLDSHYPVFIEENRSVTEIRSHEFKEEETSEKELNDKRSGNDLKIGDLEIMQNVQKELDTETNSEERDSLDFVDETLKQNSETNDEPAKQITLICNAADSGKMIRHDKDRKALPSDIDKQTDQVNIVGLKIVEELKMEVNDGDVYLNEGDEALDSSRRESSECVPQKKYAGMVGDGIQNGDEMKKLRLTDNFSEDENPEIMKTIDSNEDKISQNLQILTDEQKALTDEDSEKKNGSETVTTTVKEICLTASEIQETGMPGIVIEETTDAEIDYKDAVEVGTGGHGETEKMMIGLKTSVKVTDQHNETQMPDDYQTEITDETISSKNVASSSIKNQKITSEENEALKYNAETRADLNEIQKLTTVPEEFEAENNRKANESITSEKNERKKTKDEITADKEINEEVTMDDETRNEITADDKTSDDMIDTTKKQIMASGKTRDETTTGYEIKNEVDMENETEDKITVNKQKRDELKMTNKIGNKVTKDDIIREEFAVNEKTGSEMIMDDTITSEIEVHDEIRDEITAEDKTDELPPEDKTKDVIAAGDKARDEITAEDKTGDKITEDDTTRSDEMKPAAQSEYKMVEDKKVEYEEKMDDTAVAVMMMMDHASESHEEIIVNCEVLTVVKGEILEVNESECNAVSDAKWKLAASVDREETMITGESKPMKQSTEKEDGQDSVVVSNENEMRKISDIETERENLSKVIESPDKEEFKYIATSDETVTDEQLKTLNVNDKNGDVYQTAEMVNMKPEKYEMKEQTDEIASIKEEEFARNDENCKMIEEDFKILQESEIRVISERERTEIRDEDVGQLKGQMSDEEEEKSKQEMFVIVEDDHKTEKINEYFSEEPRDDAVVRKEKGAKETEKTENEEMKTEELSITNEKKTSEINKKTSKDNDEQQNAAVVGFQLEMVENENDVSDKVEKAEDNRLLSFLDDEDNGMSFLPDVMTSARKDGTDLSESRSKMDVKGKGEDEANESEEFPETVDEDMKALEINMDGMKKADCREEECIMEKTCKDIDSSAENQMASIENDVSALSLINRSRMTDAFGAMGENLQMADGSTMSGIGATDVLNEGNMKDTTTTWLQNGESAVDDFVEDVLEPNEKDSLSSVESNQMNGIASSGIRVETDADLLRCLHGNLSDKESLKEKNIFDGEKETATVVTETSSRLMHSAGDACLHDYLADTCCSHMKSDGRVLVREKIISGSDLEKDNIRSKMKEKILNHDEENLQTKHSLLFDSQSPIVSKPDDNYCAGKESSRHLDSQSEEGNLSALCHHHQSLRFCYLDSNGKETGSLQSDKSPKQHCEVFNVLHECITTGAEDRVGLRAQGHRGSAADDDGVSIIKRSSNNLMSDDIKFKETDKILQLPTSGKSVDMYADDRLSFQAYNSRQPNDMLINPSGNAFQSSHIRYLNKKQKLPTSSETFMNSSEQMPRAAKPITGAGQAAKEKWEFRNQGGQNHENDLGEREAGLLGSVFVGSFDFNSAAAIPFGNDSFYRSSSAFDYKSSEQQKKRSIDDRLWRENLSLWKEVQSEHSKYKQYLEEHQAKQRQTTRTIQELQQEIYRTQKEISERTRKYNQLHFDQEERKLNLQPNKTRFCDRLL